MTCFITFVTEGGLHGRDRDAISTHVALFGHGRLAGVDAHSHSQLHLLPEVVGGQVSLTLDRRHDRVVGL